LNILNESIEASLAVLLVVRAKFFIGDPALKYFAEELALILASHNILKQFLMHRCGSQRLIGPIRSRVLVFLSFVEMLRKVHHFFESTVVRVNRIVNLL
jgi:hypothetical protein